MTEMIGAQTDEAVPRPGATLAIDAGTSLVKAVVFHEAGHEMGVGAVATTVLTPQPSHSEQDMGELWAAVVSASRDAVSTSATRVGRVVVTAQGDGAWLVDADGRAIGPAILWNDGRARTVVERWRADGTIEAAATVNRSMTNAGLPHAILRYLLDEAPERLTGAAAVLTCGSWAFLRLTGVLGLHESEASVPWLDVVKRTYAGELVDRFGLSDLRHVLPPLLAADAAHAPVMDGVAEEIGLDPGTPVVLAPYDLLTAAAGSGAVAVGDAVCILGTTLCVAELTDSAESARPAAGLTLADREGRYLRAIPTLAGTGVLDWLARLLGHSDVPSLLALADDVPPGARGVTLWPYLSPAGERAPFLDPDVRGLIGGLSFAHGTAEVARAALEGLAHVIRECLDALPHRPRTLAMAGGGARSDGWCQIIADVTGVRVVRPTDQQVGAKGAMLYALVVTGQVPDLASAAERLVVPDRAFDPDPDTQHGYEQRHGEFLAARQALAEVRAAAVAGTAGSPSPSPAARHA